MHAVQFCTVCTFAYADVVPDLATDTDRDSASPGRRELNKARTHEAIVGSLRELVEQMPVAEITVDQVAERAGISRRTFFNYFGSIPAVLSAAIAGFAAEMLAGLDREHLGKDPVAAMRGLVLHRGIPVDLLGWLAALKRIEPETEAAVLLERTVWSDLAAWLEGQLHELLEIPDPLYVSTLAAAVMSCFKAAEEAWVPEPGAPDDTLSGTDVESFYTHLDRALGHLAHGWRSENP